MRKVYFLTVTFFVSILITSCSIDEKTSFNSKFGGHYNMDINLGAMLTFMDDMMAELAKEAKEAENLGEPEIFSESIESFDGEEVENQTATNPATAFLTGLTSGFQELIVTRDSIEQNWGVQNLVITLDTVNYKVNLAFDFPNLKSLSNFIQAFNEAKTEDKNSLRDAKASSTIVKSVDWVFLKDKKLVFKGVNKSSDDNNDETASMMQLMPSIFEKMTITREFEFSKKIKSVNHPYAQINDKTVKISTTYQQEFDYKLDTKDIIIEFEK